MVLSQKRAAVGRFSNYINVKQALSELQKAGFPVAQISLVANSVNYQHQFDGAGLDNFARGEAIADAATVAITGGLLGSVIGCLMGLGLLTVPGIGLLIATGMTGTAVVTTIAGAGIGATSGGLISVLSSSAIFFDQATVDCKRCQQDEYLLIVDGTDDEVPRAASILSRLCSSQVWIY